jgi:hypothetical protein
MQPRDFRCGQGDATGWRGVLQDQDPTTAEALRLGYVKYASATGLLPDTTPAGNVTTASFNVFGTAGAHARLFTLTLTTKVTLPTFSGIAIELPAPATAWPSDGLTVHVQDGDHTTVPAASRVQWTYEGAAANAFRVAGSTLYLGGLYDCGTIQVVAHSKAYGPQRLLAGAESLLIDATSGDRTGFILRNSRFPAPMCVDLGLIAADYQPVPLPTPYKFALITTHLLQIVMLPDSQGTVTSIGFPVPKDSVFCVQAAHLNFQTTKIEFSDACRVRTR